MSTTQQSSSSATMAFVTSWEQQSKLTDEQNHQIQQLSQLFERPFPSHVFFSLYFFADFSHNISY